jgi:formylmethanofuran dehydrogenase subunit E
MSGPTSTKLDASETPTGAKRCIQCGRDVSHSKRMKDSRGRYWCYDCGAADQARKGSSLMTPCAKCGKPTAPQDLHRSGEQYVCGACHDSARESRTGSAGKGRADALKLLFGVVAAAVGIGLVVLYHLGHV